MAGRSETVEILRRSTIFSVLGDREASALASSGRRERFEPGERLFNVGDPAPSIQIVLGGVVRIWRLTEDGHMLVLRRCRAGEVLGQMSALDGSDHSVGATAETRAEVLSIPASVYRELIGSRPDLAIRLAGVLAGRVRSLSDDLERMKFETIGARVVRLLREMAGGGSIIRTTHQDLADQAGSNRENVSRVLGLLRDRGVVRLGRGVIEILDEEALSADRL